MNNNFGDVRILNARMAQTSASFTYRFARKNGWWLSAVFGNQAWLIRPTGRQTDRFLRAQVQLEIPPSVNREKFEQHVEAHNNVMYEKHKRYLLGKNYGK